MPVYGASVMPETIPGNDSNPNDYTPPEGCIHYEIPNSEDVGTHTVSFNELGEPSPDGPFTFTVVVGQEQGESFTKVLSWSSNFPIYAVIVKGGDAFNLYQYESTVREDTDLVSPNTSSGNPADVSHVSIVICPGQFPPITPCPTCPPCPTSPPCPPNTFCCAKFITLFVLITIVFFLLGLIMGTIYMCQNRKNYDNKKTCEKKYSCKDNKCDCESPYMKYTKSNNRDI